MKENNYEYMNMDVLESLPYGIIVFDKRERILMVNNTVQKIITIGREDKTLQPVYDLGDAVLKKYPVLKNKFHLQKSVQSIFMHDIPFMRFHSIPIKDKFFDITLRPLHRKGRGMMIFTDVSKLKENNDIKAEFLAMIFHQLKMPLTGMNWVMDMLLGEEVGKINLEQKGYLEELQIRNKQTMKLVNQFLNISHVESGPLVAHLEKLDINDLIQEIFSDIKPLIKENKVNVRYTPVLEFPEVLVDKNLLYQVIHNILTNAIRYSSDKKGAVVDISLTQKPQSFIISVKDHGIGIPQKSQKNIFQKFFQADNALKKDTTGSGFGLYIVKKIVELCDGEIWFDSEEHEGTTFFVEFPL